MFGKFKNTRKVFQMEKINQKIMKFSIFLIFLILQNVSSLQILILDIPSPTIVGESVELTCSYDLEGVKLYSVKWYKNGTEFFRYVPRENPSIRVLPIPGIKVDVSRSNKKSVYLKHVDLLSEGIYRCEVSGEEPDFATVEKEKEMKIFLLPSEGPSIRSSKTRMKPGDVVTVNCTSARSKPPTVLEWFINDHLIDSRAGNEYEIVEQSKKDKFGTEVTSLSVKFLVSKKHYSNGLLRLKCTAKVARLFTMTQNVEESNLDDEEEEEKILNQDNNEINHSVYGEKAGARNHSCKTFTNVSYFVLILFFLFL